MQVLLQVRVTVTVRIRFAIAGVFWIKTVGLFPGIRHPIVIAIRRGSACHCGAQMWMHSCSTPERRVWRGVARDLP